VLDKHDGLCYGDQERGKLSKHLPLTAANRGGFFFTMSETTLCISCGEPLSGADQDYCASCRRFLESDHEPTTYGDRLTAGFSMLADDDIEA